MEKKTTLIVGLALALFLVGAGCAPVADDNSGSQSATSDAEEQSPTTTLDTSSTELQTGETIENTVKNYADNKNDKMEGEKPSDETKTGELTLQAEALGNGNVKLTWETDKSLTDANHFVIVRSVKANPEYIPNKTFWRRQYQKNRDTVWPNNPTGQQHFRICLTENNQPDTCTTYSNDVLVEVK